MLVKKGLVRGLVLVLGLSVFGCTGDESPDEAIDASSTELPVEPP